MIKANDPNRKSWLEVAADSDFPIQNIPFSSVETPSGERVAATRIGDQVISLNGLMKAGLLKGTGLPENVFDSGYLNELMELSKKDWRAIRDRLAELFDANNNEIDRSNTSGLLFHISDVKAVMPVKIGDYTDFYSSRQHATNVGTMFRDPDNALLPNWLHIPVGYHGRASSIILSDQAIKRPKGQQMIDGDKPTFGPSRMVDFELEVGFFTGKGKPLGDTITTQEAEDYIFGLVLFNDWSARDIQKWEYVPLGPFLAKNFASSMSPWIVTLDAMDPFRIEGEKQEPEVLPYLKFDGPKTFDVNLEVLLASDSFGDHSICKSNFKYMYWNMAQQLAHHTVNGCNMNAGDFLASGTISGNTPDSYGSMLELAWKGTKPLQMPDGSERKFILDGDTVVMKGHCQADNYRIGFGEVRTKLLPSS